MIQLRSLAEADMADVLRIQAGCYFAIEPESRESLRAKILACPFTCIAAQADGAMVGYLIAAPIRYPDLPALDAPTFRLAGDADTLYLHDLAIAGVGRGTGAGRALVRHVLAVGQRLGLARACLVAIQGSAPYWSQFGFEKVEAPPAGVVAKLGSYGADAQLMQAPF